MLVVQGQSLENCENNTMKLSVNEAKLTGLWASNCATIQQVVILTFAFESFCFCLVFWEAMYSFSKG